MRPHNRPGPIGPGRVWLLPLVKGGARARGAVFDRGSSAKTTLTAGAVNINLILDGTPCAATGVIQAVTGLVASREA